MFRLIEPSSDQNHSTGTFSECVHNETKHVAEFLVFDIDYQYICCVIDEKKIAILLPSSCAKPRVIY
jgi:hypothetical protein